MQKNSLYFGKVLRCSVNRLSKCLLSVEGQGRSVTGKHQATLVLNVDGKMYHSHYSATAHEVLKSPFLAWLHPPPKKGPPFDLGRPHCMGTGCLFGQHSVSSTFSFNQYQTSQEPVQHRNKCIQAPLLYHSRRCHLSRGGLSSTALSLLSLMQNSNVSLHSTGILL